MERKDRIDDRDTGFVERLIHVNRVAKVVKRGRRFSFSALVVVGDGKVVASLALPVAGLLSDESLEKVVAGLDNVDKAAAELGSDLVSPFATLSFVALPVIPELRLTDLGLVDVNEFKLIDI